jgi:predicted esterase YcpF (UPF0227 family)
MQKILYIYGYGSNPKDSSTMKELNEAIKDLGFELVSIKYDQEYPDTGLNELEEYIKENNIKYVIGHSLGGFITLCINEDVKKLVINPCMKPQFELPKLDMSIPAHMLYDYEDLEEWLRSGNDTPWVSQSEDVMGLFGDNDELFSYYESFKKVYPRSYYINADHRPKKEAYTEDIKNKIKEFFS